MQDLIPKDMTDTAMWAVCVGFLSPIVLNFLISAKWSATVKALAAFGFSIILGTITALLTGSYAGLGIPSAILLTMVVSITAYQSFWAKVGLSNRNSTKDSPPS
jgi:FtsH-binding integral membrane protein